MVNHYHQVKAAQLVLAQVAQVDHLLNKMQPQEMHLIKL